MMLIHACAAACVLVSAVAMSAAQPPQLTGPAPLAYVGGDVSMLPELERFGATYRDVAGAPRDAIEIFRSQGWNLFRVRLFVNPTDDFDQSWGATQSLPMVRRLCKRVHDAGGILLLDLHYSDTWADPEHQTKPAAWKDLSFDELEQRVHDYTADVLQQLKSEGIVPEMVQVGNEVTAGMLWPDAKLWDVPPEQRPQQWTKLSRLLNAGARAVRAASTPDKPIRVMIHAHGGGKLDLKRAFFDQLNDVDFDAIGLSFYPGWGESIDTLARQIATLSKDKPVMVVETAYPRKEVDIKPEFRQTLAWPLTPEGQARFARDLNRVARDAGAIGVCWWYPEATPVKGHAVYRHGAEGLFDDEGRALPTINALIGTPDPTTNVR
jgi:arabinogalactan endo-1,4-beta-galactosidase